VKSLQNVIIVGLVIVGGWWVYTSFIAGGARTCNRIVDLCGDTVGIETDTCQEHLDELSESKPEVADRIHTCVKDADSCAEVIGCGVGAAFNLKGGAVNRMLKGLGRMLTE